MAVVAKYPWYFETDTARDALAGRRLLEQYLSDHCEGDVFAASVVYGELVSNVVKHAPPGGVRVWLERQGGRYVLCINDSGPGFNPRKVRDLPDANAESVRGLYLIRQMVKGLSFRKRKGDGFVVRAVLPLACPRQGATEKTT